MAEVKVEAVAREPLTIPEMLDAANNEIQAAKKEICSPADEHFIDALELLHAAVTQFIFGVKL